jgi:hypothetical protein
MRPSNARFGIAATGKTVYGHTSPSVGTHEAAENTPRNEPNAMVAADGSYWVSRWA